MSYDLNWDVLNKAVNPEQTKYAFTDVQHLFKKVAFDVYKPLNGSSMLWELRDEPEGKFLYALYDEPEDITVKSEKDVSQEWEATSDKDGKNVTLSYKSVPIVRFASDRYKFAPSEANFFAEFLKAKTADQHFIDKLLKILPDNKRQMLDGFLNQKNREA